MNAGNKPVLVRLPAELLQAIGEEILASYQVRKEGQWTVSSWIRQAIRDKLAHCERSRKRKDNPKFKCESCGATMKKNQIGSSMRTLDGETRLYRCQKCSR
jgi:DNA-directed RNA polymerase subunit RPC12/RpoP